MIDLVTKKPIRVTEDGDGPYIIVRLDQLDELKSLLDRAGQPYYVDKYAISHNDGPYATIVYLKQRADARAIQELLDKNEALN